MFYIFTGDDRERCLKEIRRILGDDPEVFEGEKLSLQDLINICQGMSLFSGRRKILIRDLTPIRKDEGEDEGPGIDFYTELIKYVNTPHEIVIWETNKSRKKSFAEFKKAKGVKFFEFKIRREDFRRLSGILDLAFRDGKQAVMELRKLEDETEPYSLVGVFAFNLCEKYNYRRGEKEKRALEALSRVDMLMKTTSLSPWTYLESFLLQVSSL